MLFAHRPRGRVTRRFSTAGHSSLFSDLLVPERLLQSTRSPRQGKPYKQEEPRSMKPGFLRLQTAVATPQSYRRQSPPC